MLHVFTWKQFGIAIGGAGLLYYLIVLFKFYRHRLTRLFDPPETLKTPVAADHNLFGTAVINDSEMNLVDEDEIRFAETEPDDIDLPEQKTIILGEVADFMHELDVLVRITCEADDSKENFLMLLRLLISKHPVVAALRYAEPLTQYILAHNDVLPFELGKAEVEQEFINPSFIEF